MKKILLVLSIAVCYTLNAQEQSTYNFSVSNETYVDLENSTSLNYGTIWDDPEFTVPMGFDFQIAENIFNTIYFPGFGYGGLLSSSNNSYPVSVLIPIAQDIVDRGDDSDESLSPLSYKIEGESGNQILKIEWNNVGFIEDETQNDYMNFQIWLYEGTNIIEYRYGPNSIQNPDASFEGESGPVVELFPSINGNGNFNSPWYALINDPSDPTVLEVFADDQTPETENLLIGAIPDGIVYQFTPSTLSTENYKENTVSFYPNPVENEIHISSTDNASYNFSIYNSLGQLVKENIDSSENVDVSDLSSGIYFMKIKTANATVTKKFIKK